MFDRYQVEENILPMARWSQWRARCRTCGMEYAIGYRLDRLRHWWHCRKVRKMYRIGYER